MDNGGGKGIAEEKKKGNWNFNENHLEYLPKGVMFLVQEISQLSEEKSNGENC